MTLKLPKFRSVQTHINKDDCKGWCTSCGKWTHSSCEPDASNYECPKCKKKSCFGAEELLIRGMVDMGDKS